MSQSHFFAHLSRLKLINRWPLMRNVRTENVSGPQPAGGDGRPRAGGD